MPPPTWGFAKYMGNLTYIYVCYLWRALMVVFVQL
jgi:hypothetical protein